MSWYAQQLLPCLGPTALRFHCPLGMSQGCLAFYLKVPVVGFCHVLSAMVVQRETSRWRGATALENYSNDSRLHYWVGVTLQNASWGPPGVIVQQPFVPLQEAKSLEFHFLPKSTSLVFFSCLFLLSSPLLYKFCPSLSFIQQILSFFFPYHHATYCIGQRTPGDDKDNLWSLL